MEGLRGRSGVREEPSRYEAVGLTLVTVDQDNFGGVLASYPEPKSSLTVDSLFTRIYTEYDLRYVYQAPALESKTRRIEWAPESEALGKSVLLEYEPRVSSERAGA